jgi:ATP:cob(I)alamin adenosyltransferase
MIYNGWIISDFRQVSGMANRLSKIYTRTGDSGTTGLGDGSRVAKSDLRVEAMGDVDELNAVLGMLLVEDVAEDVRDSVLAIQHDLFDLGGELCMPGHTFIQAGRVTFLELTLDAWNEESRRCSVSFGAYGVSACRACLACVTGAVAGDAGGFTISESPV